jgi:hypothetical protein
VRGRVQIKPLCVTCTVAKPRPIAAPNGGSASVLPIEPVTDRDDADRHDAVKLLTHLLDQ